MGLLLILIILHTHTVYSIYIYMHSVYFCQMVVNASFHMTMLLWKQYVLSYSPCHNNQHAEGVGGGAYYILQ